jgi:phage shock protein C
VQRRTTAACDHEPTTRFARIRGGRWAMSTEKRMCQRCQREVPVEARFCPVCGARVSGSPRVLRRRRDIEKLAGVCAGLADYFDVDPTLMRVVYLVATFFTGIIPGLILYVVLAFVIPAS